MRREIVDEKLNQLRKVLTEATSQPAHVAAADQIRAAAMEVAMHSLYLQLVALQLAEEGDQEKIFKHMLMTAAHYKSKPPDLLAAAMVFLSTMVSEVLVGQWGSIEKVFESMEDPDLPLFVEVRHEGAA
jgi:hypothetical protein